MYIVETKLQAAFWASITGSAPVAPALAVLDELQGMLPAVDGDAGLFAAGRWGIADAAAMPILLRMRAIYALRPPSMKAEQAEEALAALDSARFARLRKYIDDNMERPNVAMTWDKVRTFTANGLS